MQLSGQFTLACGRYNYILSPTTIEPGGYKVELHKADPCKCTAFSFSWFLMLPDKDGILTIPLPPPLNEEWQEIQDKLQQVLRVGINIPGT